MSSDSLRKDGSPSCIIVKEQKCSNGEINLMNNLLLTSLDPESKSGIRCIECSVLCEVMIYNHHNSISELDFL